MIINEINTSKVKYNQYSYRFSWIKLIRPMTLTGSISPVLAGSAIAAKDGQMRIDIFLAMLFAAILVQATINIFNDYYDFKNGQDQEKWIGPDEENKRGPKHEMLPVIACAMISISILLGAWLAIQSSYWIVVVGTLGIIFGYAYSAGRHSLCSIGLGELVAAIFLGPVATTLAYVVHGHSLGISIFAVSLPFAFLISSMILSNNIRDLEKDKGFRRTLAMRLGRIKASQLLTLLLSLAYLWVLVMIYFGIVSWLAGACLFALPVALRLRWSYRPKAERKDEIAGMKWAAWHHWAFGLLFSLGLWISIL